MTILRLPAIGFVVGLLTAMLTLSPDRAAAAGSADPASKSQYVGLWNTIDGVNWRSVISLNADGTCSNGTGRYGTWIIDGNQLVMHYDAHSDWADRFGLPMHSGILKGKAGGGEPRTMTQRATSAPAATYAALAGSWEYFNHENGHRASLTLAPDGSVTEDGRAVAAWMIENNRLYYSYIEPHDWVDSYDLPPRNGVLHSAKGGLTLTRPDAAGAVAAASPAATVAPQPAAAASPAMSAALSAITGTWDFYNSADGKRVKDTFNPDGVFLENGVTTGAWKSNGSQLTVTYRSHPEWFETYNLPPREGVLRGANGGGPTLTLTRAGATLPVSTGASGAAGTAATDPAPASATRSSNPGATGYFGARDGAAVASGSSAAATPLPAIAATPSAAIPAGSFAGGKPGAVVTTTVTPVPGTPAPATPASVALTPAGKWHWHSGADHQLTDKGAILENLRVVGQWKWLDQAQRKVLVQWTVAPRRAPMTYILSERGNHLVGTSPESGKEHSEDRIE